MNDTDLSEVMGPLHGTEVIPIRKREVKNAYVIDGFPSVGLVGSIAANYLVTFLKLELIAVMDAPFFPAISMIRDRRPNSPVRVYAGDIGKEQRDRIVVFVSEFQPPPAAVKPLANAMMDWIEENKCRMLISPEGMAIPKDNTPEEFEYPLNQAFGVASTDSARSLLDDYEIPPFETGVIMGLAGVLLNEGVNRDFDVISLLSTAQADYPDARAAAACISAIDRILLHVELDTEPLLKEAEIIEEHLKEVYKNAGEESPGPKSIMYG
ncbi:MAG: proteasome assembly chaperone family protein [Methanomassiliicoccales archaeon]